MMSYVYPPVGASYNQTDDNCTFTVWAPLREQVVLLVDERSHPLTRDERGYWSTTIKGIRPGTKYIYKLDNGNLLPDPASRCQPDGVHKASEVVDPFFRWDDSDWKGIALKDMVQYELHVGTFTDQHNFDGVISRLPYLKQLGINAIEILPVAQFPGTRNWGYDGVYPYAVQYSYGGYNGLKRLVNEAHREGIAVILDVVYNHQGPEGNYFSEFGPYFTDKYRTGWGQAINYDDAWCDGVRNFYWQNALMWLDEFHIDGLRLDAVHAIWDFSARHFIQELRSKVSVLEQQTGRKKILIAEFDLNNPRYINPLEKGGYGLDGQWIDEYHHALHSLITGEVDGYYEDFGKTEHLIHSLKDSYVYTGEYSIHRKKHFGVKPELNPYSQFIVFSQNHDQVGNRFLGDRLTSTLSFEALKLTAAAVLLSPHVPMLFMGEEYGEKNPFQYFISHTDKALVELVRKGRKEEFSYFNWKGEVPDPQSEETFNKCVLSWNNEDDHHNTLLKFYRHLISFRKSHPAMANYSRGSVRVLPPSDKKIVAFERLSETGETILIIMNFEKHRTSFSYKSPLQKILDSSSDQWNGPGDACDKLIAANQYFNINPESAIAFQI